MNNNLKDVTVFLLPNGKQFTVEGKVKPIDMVGCSYKEEITEVVDDYLVHCFTISTESIVDESIVDEYVEEKQEERLEYLRNKSKVCPLDKEERYELDILEGGY